MSDPKYTLIDNKEKNRFEFRIADQVAVADYHISGNVISIPHVGVPKVLEGQGIASALVLAVLKNIDERQLKLIPICPFVVTYVQRHPEWKKLLN
ncbi:MAG: N-acetyltransferase [Bdellovibrionaceae bacterium]|nr:N-acetyltransferase [Pseudobdellovibrionaceae bacterium]